MSFSGLSFQTMPSISVPFRFFLTAPLMLALAGFIILFYGVDLWTSRWHPATLALTHIMMLGVFSMTMLGALLQMLPVMTGFGVKHARQIGAITHISLTLGCLSLVMFFLTRMQWLAYTALITLGIAFSVYIIALVHFFAKQPSKNITVSTIKLAVSALFFTVVLGAIFVVRDVSAGAYFSDVVAKSFTNIHAVTGGLGWVALLIIAVSFQVIPMFHVAPSFPKLVARWTGASLIACLLLFSFFPHIQQFALTLLMLVLSSYAVALLRQLSQRKRKVFDVTVFCWQFSAAYSLLITLAILLLPYWQTLFNGDAILMLSALWLHGFALTILFGMLMKILPFLTYTHLQQYCMSNFSAMQFLPNMHQLLSKQQAQALLCIHLCSAGLLLAVFFLPQVNLLLGLSLLVEAFYLLYLMMNVVREYRQVQRKMTLMTTTT